MSYHRERDEEIQNFRQAAFDRNEIIGELRAEITRLRADYDTMQMNYDTLEAQSKQERAEITRLRALVAVKDEALRGILRWCQKHHEIALEQNVQSALELK